MFVGHHLKNKANMNFLTPLLFVFYLQVMPPPPTVVGGGDYWAGDTVDENNVVIIPGWTTTDLAINLDGHVLAGYTYTGYLGLNNILDAIEGGFLINLTLTDWSAIFDRAPFWGNIDNFNKACRVAFGYGGPGETMALQRGCVPEAPLPKKLVFLIIFSFLGIYFISSTDGFCRNI